MPKDSFLRIVDGQRSSVIGQQSTRPDWIWILDSPLAAATTGGGDCNCHTAMAIAGLVEKRRCSLKADCDLSRE
ncbi:Hypothetical predicted protein [Olea europaea subsp. europaea]|uniref:Uncharacterized protein n=1 Tax=Olea europaea subsp. europaea TaxID=158383 RepID=A0A8S0T5R7_OLEEU|nr:Hypothetical predicted protein [Olea europaea subsp. europaea]